MLNNAADCLVWRQARQVGVPACQQLMNPALLAIMNAMDRIGRTKTWLLLLGVICLSLSRATAAADADKLKLLSFTISNRQIVQTLVSRPEKCAALVRSAVIASLARTQTGISEPVAVPKVIDACQAVSLNHDGRLQVVCLARLDGGDGPLGYVAVFKHSGLLDETDIPVGEGSGQLGPISLSLKDINHDGRLELIEQTRHVDVNGHIGAQSDPTPKVTYIHVWRNNTFALANREFRSYFVTTVLPDLRRELAGAQSLTSASPDIDKKVVALKSSIDLANTFLVTGHY